MVEREQPRGDHLLKKSPCSDCAAHARLATNLVFGPWVLRMGHTPTSSRGYTASFYTPTPTPTCSPDPMSSPLFLFFPYRVHGHYSSMGCAVTPAGIDWYGLTISQATAHAIGPIICSSATPTTALHRPPNGQGPASFCAVPQHARQSSV